MVTTAHHILISGTTAFTHYAPYWSFAIGTPTCAKVELIDAAARRASGSATKGLSKNAVVRNALGKEVGIYTAAWRNIGLTCSVISVGCTIVSTASYYANGGTGLGNNFYK